MESYGTPQTTQGVAKIVGCHPQTDGQVPLLNMEKPSWGLHSVFTPAFYHLCFSEVFYVNTNPATNSQMDSNGVLPTRYATAEEGTAKQYLVWLKTHSTK